MCWEDVGTTHACTDVACEHIYVDAIYAIYPDALLVRWAPF